MCVCTCIHIHTHKHPHPPLHITCICAHTYMHIPTGKTFSMDGDDEHLGIMPRVFAKLFDYMKASDSCLQQCRAATTGAVCRACRTVVSVR